MLEALSIMVIARVPECLAFHVEQGERGYQVIKGEQQQQRAGGEWRAGERVSVSGAVCDVTGSLRGRLVEHLPTGY